MIITENEIQDVNLEKLEAKNFDELESLERLIIFFEDIKNIEISNLDYAKEILKEIEFNQLLIFGQLAKACKSYFESYYDLKSKQTESLTKIINIMKLKSSVSQKYDININASSINENPKASQNIDSNDNLKYLSKKDILEIFDSMALINKFNIDYNNSYTTFLVKELNGIKSLKKLDEFDILKGIKDQKSIFENKIKDICEKGEGSSDFHSFKDALIKDNSKDQRYITWTINYLNKYRAKFCMIEEKVFQAFKILFEIILSKLIERKLYQALDLTIILLQTFSKMKDNDKILLEDEFKNHKMFQNNEIWENLINQKIQDLLGKIQEESKENKEELINDVYIKENIEPIFISYIFTMKDFNLNDETKRKVIEHICKMKEYAKYNFNIEQLMAIAGAQ